MGAEELSLRCKEIASLIRVAKVNLRDFHSAISAFGANVSMVRAFFKGLSSTWEKIKWMLSGVSRVTLKFNVHYVDHAPVVYPYRSGVRFVNDDVFGAIGKLIRFIEKNLNWILKLVAGIGSIAGGITTFAGGMKAGAKFFAKYSAEAPKAISNVSGGIKQAQILINNMRTSGE